MVVVGNVVATASDEGMVAGLDPTSGSVLWSLPVPRGEVSVWALGKVGDHTVLAMDEDGFVTAIDAASGTMRWSKDLTAGYYDPPIEVGGVLAVGVEGGEVAFVDPATGEEVRDRLTGPAISMQAAPGGAEALVAIGIDVVQSVDLDGEVLWSTPTPFSASELVVAEGAVVVTDLEGEMATFLLEE